MDFFIPPNIDKLGFSEMLENEGGRFFRDKKTILLRKLGQQIGFAAEHREFAHAKPDLLPPQKSFRTIMIVVILSFFARVRRNVGAQSLKPTKECEHSFGRFGLCA